MTRIAGRFLVVLFALFAAAPAAFAQAPRAAVQGYYSQAELDQMLAPIALYPDALLSQVLMAATYPDEVREAARWSRANLGLEGDDAVRAAQYKDWDPSVQSLVAFPQVLARMDENPDWTRRLGETFLGQQPHVMDTVQQLRRRAQAAGNLQSNEQLYVQQRGQTIVLQPASPQYVYVPYYDPLVVYGPWWWPAYRPVAWAPWHGYARPYRPGVSAGFWWGTPVGLSFNFFFGDFDWHHRHAHVAHPNAYYYHSAAQANRTLAVSPQRWQPDTRRREAFAARRANQAQQDQVQSAARVTARMQAQPAAAVQAQPNAQTRTERREDRREERRENRREERQAVRVQAQPAATVHVQPQSAAQPRSERREEKQAARAPAAVPSQIPMPAAVAPQQPRAERQEQRQEQRQERREKRQEQRQERGQKG